MQVNQRVSTIATKSQTRWALKGATAAGGQIRIWELRDAPFRIGRRSVADLTLKSPIVSGIHAEVICRGGSVFIRDVGSTNGTWVNGRRITNDFALSEGDVIEIGDAILRLQDLDRDEVGSRTCPLMHQTLSVEDTFDGEAHNEFTRLLSEKSLLPCFQALHDLETNEVRGHEFLARSGIPGLGSALQLFDRARTANREVELSMLCRERAMHFSPLVGPVGPIFVNTHPAEPLLEVVVPQMRLLKQHYPQIDMVLEIHEAAITEPALIRETRSLLAESGVRLAFDDFGRGQARIRELICAQSDYIKFDSALISDLEHVQPEQFRFFRSIIQGIREAGAITVAEGVESESMAEVCREVGFDLVQGYLFSRPRIYPTADSGDD